MTGSGGGGTGGGDVLKISECSFAGEETCANKLKKSIGSTYNSIRKPSVQWKGEKT